MHYYLWGSPAVRLGERRGKIASVAAALGKLCSVGIEAVNWWRKLMDSGGVLLAPLFAKMIIVCLT